MGKIEVINADITTLEVDAIVNAANRSLLGGGGVDGAIHDAAGRGLLAECRTLGGCKIGEVRVTGAHDLPFNAIIHAVGPIWRGGGRQEEALLRSCYENAFDAAAGLGAESIAFPAISTGAFGFPPDLAASIAARTCVSWDREKQLPNRILLMAFDGESEEVLSRALKEASSDR